ncbi:DNA methyltransferase [Pseudomonas aeruginosa]|uniref:DNA methyltransferase n=1 Tax=Pseudomonas aeruginosa TaxID=287 RepID=UPI0031B6A54B
MRLHPGKRPSTSATKTAAGRAGLEIFGNRHHPTEKPVTSLQPLIESFTHPNAIVLDPFAGSGSTCVAALQSGRRYIGIELLEQYHRAGQQRLAAVQRAMQQGAANDNWFEPEAA